MLLTHDKVKEFSKKPIADAHKTLEVLTALAVEGKAKAHELADKALKAGAKEAYSPKDYGFMFTRGFEDPDGHIWELFWMVPACTDRIEMLSLRREWSLMGKIDEQGTSSPKDSRRLYRRFFGFHSGQPPEDAGHDQSGGTWSEGNDQLWHPCIHAERPIDLFRRV